MRRYVVDDPVGASLDPDTRLANGQPYLGAVSADHKSRFRLNVSSTLSG